MTHTISPYFHLMTVSVGRRLCTSGEGGSQAPVPRDCLKPVSYTHLDVYKRQCERRFLRTVFRGVQENGMWRRRYNYKLCHLYKEPDIIRTIKIYRLRWVGHIKRMEEGQPTKRIFYQLSLIHI